MGPGKRLQEARKRYQEDTGKSTEAVVRELFPRLPKEKGLEKLRRIESDSDIRPLSSATRYLQIYGLSLGGQTQALVFYQLGQRLSELVARSGYTKAFLAEQSGFSYHHFSRILSGTRPVATPEKLLRIAELLGASTSEKNDLFRIAEFPDYDPLLLEVSQESEEHSSDDNTSMVEQLREQLSSDSDVALESESHEGLDVSDDYAIGPVGITDLAIKSIRRVVKGSREKRDSAPKIRISLGRHFVGDHRLLQEFLSSVCGALSSGVEIRCLIPAPRTPRDAFNAVSNSLTFLGVQGGKYSLRLDTREEGDSHDASRSIIFPGGSVLQFLPKEESDRRDSALMVKDPNQLFRGHFERRFQDGSSLLKIFQSSKDDPGAFQAALAEAEAEPGPRLIIRRRPPTAMLSTEHWDEEKRQILPSSEQGTGSRSSASPWRFERLAVEKLLEGGSEEGCEAYLERLRLKKLQRLARMNEALRKDAVREVYPKDVLADFFASKDAPKDIRVAIIEQFVKWLEDYENYRVALAPTSRLTSTAFFGIHGGDNVFLSVWRQASGADYLRVRHPMFTSAFKEYFVSQWKTLGPEHTDKSRVIAWFNEQRSKV